MVNILELTDPAELTFLARQVPEPIENSLAAVLPDREIDGIRSKSVRSSRKTTTAKYRSYNAEAPIGQRGGSIEVTEVKLPPISEKLPIDENLIFELSENASDPAIARARAEFYDDAENLTLSIRNRAEKARGEFLTTGKITLAENGVVDEADFGLAADHKVAPAALWSATNATPLSDEIVWMQKVTTDSGKRPTRATTSLRIALLLTKNAEYRNTYWQRGTDSPMLSLDQVNAVRASNGLAPLNVYDGLVPDDSGASVRVIADDLFILTTDSVGESQWGITAESLELVSSNAVDFDRKDAPGITVVQYRVPDPVTVWTKASATFLPVAGDIAGLLVADVA